jgi:hypothetical protein
MKVKVEGSNKFHKTELIVKEWRKRQNHVVVGYGDIVVTESSLGEVMNCSVHDERGRNVGSVELRAKLSTLSTADVTMCHEMTTTATNFTHLYRLPITAIEDLRKYIRLSRETNFVERIPFDNKHLDLELDYASDTIDWESPVPLLVAET